MIQVGIVDLTAEYRKRLAMRVEGWIHAEESNAFVPRLSCKSLAVEEVRFNPELDLCVVGPEILATDVAHIAGVKRSLPGVPLICVTDSRTQSLAVVEQLGRLGADDVLGENSNSSEFIRRIVLLTQRKRQDHGGKSVLVESAKGGAGVTSLVAGIGEAVVNHNLRACLVDLDLETQDLTRYLLAKPYINEALGLLLSQHRLPTSEIIKDCITQVWDDSEKLMCVAPPSTVSEQSYSNPSTIRSLLASKEALEGISDILIFDAAHSPESWRRALYQSVDLIVYVVGNDPGALHGAVQRLSIIRSLSGPKTKLILVENHLHQHGLSSRETRGWLEEAVGGDEVRWNPQTILFERSIFQWPGSGRTPFSKSKKFASSIEPILTALGVSASQPKSLNRREILPYLMEPLAQIALRLRSRRDSAEVQATSKQTLPQLDFQPSNEDGALVSPPSFSKT